LSNCIDYDVNLLWIN